MTASRFLVSLVAAWLVAGMAAATSPTLERIKASGTVTFGYRDGAAPFSAKQRNGKVRGYSVELCEKVAAAVGSALKLEKIATFVILSLAAFLLARGTEERQAPAAEAE